jgi:hypothetical protein
MARLLYLVQFFRVVPPVPRLMVSAFVATAVAASVMVALDSQQATAALTPLLLLQLFACSSGFLVPARRGHYDLLLTTGESRLRIACVHWAMSMLPGTVCWLAVAAVEVLVTPGSRAATLESGSVAAIVFVSTLPWALTVALPRFAGAIGWLVALAIAAAALPDDGVFDRLGGGMFWMEAVLALALYPPMLVGHDIAGAHGLLVVPVLLLASGAMAFALVWIERHDIPLEAAQ